MELCNRIYKFICRTYACHKGLVCSKESDVRGFPEIFISRDSKVFVGKNFTLRSGVRRGIGNGGASKIIVTTGASLTIGDNVGMTNVCLICRENITIGNYVLIGADTMIMDSNFHDTNWRGRMDGTHGIDKAISLPIAIGDNVFIGTRSIICKGVSIGTRSIVAAGSVVVKDIPADEIWGGNPARFIKKI